MDGPARKPRPPSIHDVARRAGVSYQTVSRVINSSSNVSAKARQVVADAIAELDYHPSSAARAFATGHGRDIAVIVADLESYGWAAMLAGVQGRARELGRSLVLHELRDPSETVSWLKSQTVHATLMLGGTATSRAVFEGGATGGRIIGVGDRAVGDHPWLTFAEYDGAVEATRHLLELGHRTVHHITVEALVGTSRQDGWRDTLPSRARPPALVIGSRPADAFDAGVRFGEQPDVTAIFCANDQIAIPLLAGIRDAGRTVPADVSVIGFDDHPLAPYSFPPLTTVRQDFGEIGRRAVDLAEGASDAVESVELPTTLVRRATTGSPTR